MTDLTPFVPVLAPELGARPGSHWNSVEGSMLSADISGFTALSEKLAGHGKAGAEEVTELVNACFTALIDSAYEFGGEVLKFGGDALLILFRGDAHERRAIDGALSMQGALAASGAARRANLSMSVGVADGPFDVFLAGSEHRELLITGPRASEAIHLEASADRGETLASPAAAAAVPPQMHGRSHDGGIAVTAGSGSEPTGPLERRPSHGELGDFVPRAVVDQLGAFEGLGGEHRIVSVGFVQASGVAEVLVNSGAERTAAAFGDLVDHVVEVATPFGVTLLHSDIAPDGVKLILCAGAPVNPGDASDALLQAAVRISAIDSPLEIRQGVQTGRVFAGFLGSPHRRTYTIMGDPVNTAARMLSQADDRDVVAVSAVVDDTRTIFITNELEPFRVKGKSEPIRAHRVIDSSDRVRRGETRSPLIGRGPELETLARAVGELGEIVVLTGPAGVGKSRLLDAAWDAAEGVTIFRGACTPYGSTSPYSLFRHLLRTGSGIDVDLDPTTTGKQLTKIVRAFAPHLIPKLPLLAVPFGGLVADTDETRAIEPAFRRPLIHEAVVEFLDSTLSGPIFLVIEDLHWADDASGELVNHLMRAAETRAWTGVVTRRPEGAWTIPEELSNVTELVLEPLDENAIRSLAIEVAPRALSDNEVDAIVERSGGNPLFAVGLATALGTSALDGLPDSIEALIASRIDNLDPDARRTIRLAAVFGREFDLHDVEAIAGDAELVLQDVDRFDGLVETLGHGGLAFTHAMYRDVAYEGLPFRRRRELHGRVGEHLEASTDDPSSLAALLSVHFSEAGRHDKSWTYSTLAGQSALDSFANEEAARSLERALKSARYHRGVDASMKADTFRLLGNAHEFRGDLQSAYRCYEQQRRLAPELANVVNAMRRMARARQKQGNLTSATKLLFAAERKLQGVRRDAWVHRLLAEIHLNIAGIRMDQGRQFDARNQGERAEYHAMKAGDDALRVQAYGAIAGALTSWDEAEPYADGLELARELDAYEAASILATNLGMSAYFAGEWRLALGFYEQARVAGRTMGNVTASSIAAMNAAEILVDQGHVDAAIDVLHDACRVFEAAGYESALLYAQLNLGTALNRRGDAADAQRMLEQCARGFRKGSMQLYALEADIRLGECRLAAGDDRDAAGIFEKALADAGQLARGRVIEARAHRLLAIAALRSGDLDGAAAAAHDAESICRRDDLLFELALALLVRHDVTSEREPMDEADHILRDLGVIAVPFHSWQPDTITTAD
jgi:class 3 adenylate cyclase/tetratricopeptide (TPR) repeat protein